MSAVIVIPARYGSTRFPGKPLARQTGKFLIQHVVEQAQKARHAERVVVATDDHRILDAVHAFACSFPNVSAVLTASTHLSGTDRIAEVLRRPEFASASIVVNVQGDEPEIDPALIDTLIETLSPAHRERAGFGDLRRPPVAPQMATAAAPFEHPDDIANPNIVKVVVDQYGGALYFSRSVIPFDRDRVTSHANKHTLAGLYRMHVGIYAYTRDFLLTLAATPPCELERLEKLEQLRALFLGERIHVANTPSAPHGIDTPEDYAQFVHRYAENQKCAPAVRQCAPSPVQGRNP